MISTVLQKESHENQEKTAHDPKLMSPPNIITVSD